MAAPHDLFLSLPAELRNQVYYYLFFSEGENIHVNGRAPNRLALLATSHVYNQEASSLFFAQAHLIFNGPSNPSPGCTILPPIPNFHVKLLKRVTLSLHTGHPSLPNTRRAANMISDLADTSADFEEITIKIGAAEYFAGFMSTLFDDPTMDIKHPFIRSLSRLIQAECAKNIRICLDKAWFAPSVVAHFLNVFAPTYERDPSRSIQIFKGNNDEPLQDFTACERTLRGRYFHDPLGAYWARDVISSSDTSSSDMSSSPGSAASYASFLDLDLGSNEDDGDGEEEELTSDDDGEMEDTALRENDDSNYQMIVNFMPDLL